MTFQVEIAAGTIAIFWKTEHLNLILCLEISFISNLFYVINYHDISHMNLTPNLCDTWSNILATFFYDLRPNHTAFRVKLASLI